MPPFRSRRSLPGSVFISLLLIFLFAISAAAEPAPADKGKGKNKGTKKKRSLATAMSSSSPGDLTNIPLPIGHEAKGLVLPDFDLEGHLRGKFVAESAKRLDEEHIGFHSLKIITYTPENKPDLTVELSESVLNLKTRILSSNEI